MNKIIRQHYIALGKKGGSVKSERKTIAARLNARRPRPNRRKKTS